jgi:hypothetical protein
LGKGDWDLTASMSALSPLCSDDANVGFHFATSTGLQNPEGKFSPNIILAIVKTLSDVKV